MRLTAREQAEILTEVRAHDPDAAVYLFGSRTRDDLKGGDIDLLVISGKIDFSAKLDLLVGIKGRIGDRKIDLKIVSPADLDSDPFVQSVLPSAIRLSKE